MDNSNIQNDLLKEIKSSIQQEGEELNKFLDMVASFADDIEEEHKRYRAAIKAMKQTSGIDQYDVMKAADRQLKKLEHTESLMTSSLEEKRADLNQLVSRATSIEDKLRDLRNQVSELEKEQSIISDRRTTKEREIGSVEESYKSVAEHLSKQIGQVKDKLARYLAEDFNEETSTPAFHPEAPLATQVESFTPEPPEAGETREAAQEEIPAVDSPLNVSSPLGDDVTSEKGSSNVTRRQKECPSCSGTMDWYAMMKMWKCYVCGHEEKVRKKK